MLMRRKIAVGVFLALLVAAVGTAWAVTYTKARLGMPDMKVGYSTFTRATSTGGTDTLYRVPPANVLAFGATGDGTTDDCDSLQAAIDHVAGAGGGIVYIPAGTYILGSPSKGTTDAYATGEGSFLHLKSGVSLVGDGQATILKVKASVGDYTSVIHQDNSAASLSYVRIADLTIDQNTANNAIAATGDLTDDPRFAIEIYMATGLVIENVHFVDADGTNTVYLNGGTSITNASIRNCRFSDVGGEATSYDHSTVYVVGRNFDITNNKFAAETLGEYGCACAIETHGDEYVIQGNQIDDYDIGMNVTGIWSSGDSIDKLILGNRAKTLYSGIRLFSLQHLTHTTGHGLRNVLVEGNQLRILQSSYTGSGRIGGIELNPASDLDADQVVIKSNLVEFDEESTAPSYGSSQASSCGIGAPVTGSVNILNMVISGNTIINAPVAGISMGVAGGTFKGCEVTDNTIINAAQTQNSSVTADYKRPIFSSVAALTGRMLIARNTIIDNFSTTRMIAAYGIYSAAATAYFDLIDNFVRIDGGTKTAYIRHVAMSGTNAVPYIHDYTDYDFKAPIVACAAGSEVYDVTNNYRWRLKASGTTWTVDGGGTAAPTAGTWRVGDVVYNSAPAGGNAGGWICTVAGTPGTWKKLSSYRSAWADSIYEQTSAAGVNADGALLKDGAFIRKVNTSARAADDTLLATEDAVWFLGQSASIFCTLPTYASVTLGKKYTILNTDATDTVFVEANGAETLNGSALRRAYALPPNVYATASFLYIGSSGWVKVD